MLAWCYSAVHNQRGRVIDPGMGARGHREQWPTMAGVPGPVFQGPCSNVCRPGVCRPGSGGSHGQLAASPRYSGGRGGVRDNRPPGLHRHSRPAQFPLGLSRTRDGDRCRLHAPLPSGLLRGGGRAGGQDSWKHLPGRALCYSRRGPPDHLAVGAGPGRGTAPDAGGDGPCRPAGLPGGASASGGLPQPLPCPVLQAGVPGAGARVHDSGYTHQVPDPGVPGAPRHRAGPGGMQPAMYLRARTPPGRKSYGML